MISILLAAVLPLVNQPFTYEGRIVDFDNISADAWSVPIRAYNSSGQFVATCETFASTHSAYNYRLAIPIASQPTDGYAVVGESLTFRISVDGEDFLTLVPVENTVVGSPGDRVRCDLMLSTDADGGRVSDDYVRDIIRQMQRYISAAGGLPEGYTAVDYIVAPRGAYIDTGYKPNQNTRVVMDVTVQGAGEYWFGCWDRNYNDGAFAFGNDGGGIYAGYGNQGGTFGSVVANGRHTVELDTNVVKVGGNEVKTYNAESFSLANNLYLFAQNRAGTFGVHDSQASVTCHGCKIYEGDDLVRDFVPCTSPSGRIGLYDLVKQSFYILTVNLPAGYTAVEYIESTKGGGQFIDTGYTANGQTKVVFDAVIPARWEQNDRFGVLFGSRTMNDWARKAFALQMCDGNSGVDTVRFAYNGEYRQDGGKPFPFGERVTVTCDGQHVEWTGSKAASVDFTSESLASSKSTLYIFADNSVADDGAKSKAGLNHSVMRLYSFRITEGETLKRDFVPCIRLADAVAGLYDTVEGKFYGNSGSGNFATSASNLPFGRELTSGTYEITESFAFAAPMGESALKIADGATVTLNVAEGVIVAVRGGDAFEVWGAGAGIEVPANATLKVTGAGQLNAYGGKGANGCNGVNGGDGSANEETGNFTSGAGGAGGWGGGGAGAGIGGHGASGGGGGNGGQSVLSYDWKYEDLDGKSGDNGGAGKNGGTCGTVSIEGTSKVFAYGGAAGDANGAGGAAGERFITDGTTYYFGAYGGGGGGGGAKGGAAQDIGGGGAGGYGGGGGGSGAYVWGRESVVDEHPGWGAGGQGANNGKSNDGNDHGGSGGAKGAGGARGGSGTLTVADGAVAYAAEGHYSVGRLSDTIEIVYDNGRLLWVSGGTSSNLSYSVVNNNTGTLGTGWYVVKGKVSRTDRILVSGAANLVLLHGSSLTVDCRGIGDSKKYAPGIEVCDDNSLRVFGTETGILTAMGSTRAAGIGTVNRFYVTPGGSAWYSCNSCGTIAFLGGTVNVTGGSSGAGIGGGENGAGGTVTINGGTVTATGGWNGAGIGGGEQGAGGTVTINGGEVTARRGQKDAEDIGHGLRGGENGTLTLAPRVFDVGGGHYRSGEVVVFERPLFLMLASATADAGPVKTTTNGREIICAILPGNRLMLNFALNDIGVRMVGDATVQVGLVKGDVRLDDALLPHAEEVLVDSVDYALPDGTYATATNVHPVHCGEDWSVISAGWYVVTQSISRRALRTQGVGVVNLILANGTTLDVDGGIRVGGDGIVIYAQPPADVQNAGTGCLSATGWGDDPGIGGGRVTINGGIVTANGGERGAGIGGGSGSGGNVTINGGTVTAIAVEAGAGIGGGFMSSGGYVTINGGTVTARSGYGGGVGGGLNSDGERVMPVGTINLGESVEIVEGSIELGSHYVKIAEKKPREMDPIGVCSWSWHEPMTNIIRRMEANGFKGIQLALSPWVWEGEGSAAQKETFGDQEGEEVFNLISNKFAKGELDIHATMICFSNEDYTTEHTISNTCGFYYGLAPSATEEQKELADLTWEIRSNQFAKAVERTRALGVRNITAHIGLSEYDDANMSRLYWACKTCRENGCKLLVETGMYSAERTVAALKRFTELHPDAEIGLNFDTANQVLYGADNPTNAYAVMKGWIEQVHIKDCVETYSSRGSWATDVEWGRGDVSRTYDMISVLKADGFAGPMLVEHESGSADPDVREREILTAVRAIRGEPAPVAAGLGEVLGPYLTAVAATNAARGAEFTPSAEVAAALGTDDARATYCNMFEFDVVLTAGGKWAVAAFLKPQDWTNVVESAQTATRQIPVAELAAQEYGTPLKNVPLTNCVPGFYYSLYDGSAVTNVSVDLNEDNRDILCGAGKTVTIPVLSQPSSASGFFAIGVLEIPMVYVPGENHVITGLHFEIPKPRRR